MLAHRKSPPGTIWAFLALYVAFALAALANNLALVDGFTSEISGALGSPAPVWLGPVSFGFRSVFRVALAYAVFWRASSLARWVAFLLVMPWLWQAIVGVPALVKADRAWFGWALAVSLQLVALSFLATPSARLWLARKGRTIANDAEEFR